jgi:AraC-like DNA-binding protein
LRWQPRPQTVKEQSEIVSQAKLTLSEHLREKITLDQLAHTVHVSPYHLCRIFKREAGLSIHRYLQRLRLLNALEHLAECPKDNLTMVALGHGFSSHSHFSTTFQREFGVSPSAFARAAPKGLTNKLSKNLKAR